MNADDFEALGGNATSALFKAPYIQDWVDTAGNPLTSNYGEQLWTGTKLFFNGSGLTPEAYLRLGYAVPAASTIGNLGDSVPADSLTGNDVSESSISVNK